MPDTSSELDDNIFKQVFAVPELFIQLLDDFVPHELLKNLSPDAVEDLTERFLPLTSNPRDADTVKRIKLPEGRAGNPSGTKDVYVIAVVEHESRVNHRMSFKLLEYMVHIWTDYENEQEKTRENITRLKGFRYPPIIPIVFYDGDQKWTASRSFLNKVLLGREFKDFMPDIGYVLIELRNHSVKDLSRTATALSFVFMVDKLRSTEDFKKLVEDLPLGYIETLQKESPHHIIELLGRILKVYMAKAGLDRSQIEAIDQSIFKRSVTSMVNVFAENVAKEKQQWWQDGWNEADQIRQRERQEMEQERIKLEQEREREHQKMEQDRRDSVREMLGDGVDIVKITKYTGLTLEEIKALDN